MKSSSQSPRDRSSRPDAAKGRGASRGGGKAPVRSPGGTGSPKPGESHGPTAEDNRNGVWDDDEVPNVMIEEEDEGVLEIVDDEDDLDDEDVTDEDDVDAPIADEQRQHPGS